VNSRKRRKGINDFVASLRSKQSNILWPDAMTNSRSADMFLWWGSTNPPLVQRIAAWLFGLCFIGLALEMLIFVDQPRGFRVMVSFVFVLIGARIFRNGFPRKQAQPPD